MDILTESKQQYLTTKDTAPKNVMLFICLRFAKSDMCCMTHVLPEHAAQLP
jgi:hypothetical protein